MKVSHEVPLVMLEESRSFNDYDYALVHLFDQYPEYLEFYKTSLKQGRMVYLDNSVFELEKMFDHFAFAKRCAELASINSDNFYYIIPDALEDKDATCNSFEEFTKTYNEVLAWVGVTTAIILVAVTVLIIWDILKLRKLNKWKQEYLASLTDEQLKAIENYKKHLI